MRHETKRGSRLFCAALLLCVAGCGREAVFAITLPADATWADWVVAAVVLDDESEDYRPLAVSGFFPTGDPPGGLRVEVEPFERIRLVVFLYEEPSLELFYELGGDAPAMLAATPVDIDAAGAALAPRAPGMDFSTLPFAGLDATTPALQRAASETTRDVIARVEARLSVNLTEAPVPPDPFDGTTHGFVVSAFELAPANGSDPAGGRDLDGDGTPDTALNQYLSAILSLTGSTPLVLPMGDGLALGELTAVDLMEDPAVSLRILTGIDLDGDPTDNFSGAEPFSWIDDAPAPLLGALASGGLDAGPGLVRLPFGLLGGDPVDPAAGTLVQGAFVSALFLQPALFTGTLAGSVREALVLNELIATFNDIVQQSAATDPVGSLIPCVSDSDCPGTGGNGYVCPGDGGGSVCVEAGGTAVAILEFMDEDGDGVISSGEIGLLNMVLTPDIDSDDDGIADSFSFVATFEAVPALLISPGG